MTGNASWSLYMYKQSRVDVVVVQCTLCSTSRPQLKNVSAGLGVFSFLDAVHVLQCSRSSLEEPASSSPKLNDGCPPIFDTYDKRC